MLLHDQAYRLQLLVRGATIVVGCAMFTLTAGLIVLRVHGAQILSVESASMVPTFRPGDALVVSPVAYTSLQTGEVISYQSPVNRRLTISHRIISIDRKSKTVITAGDARHTPDQPIPANAIIGRPFLVLTGAGWCLDKLRQPVWLALVVFLPAGMFLYTETARLGRHWAQPAYRLRL